MSRISIVLLSALFVVVALPASAQLVTEEGRLEARIAADGTIYYVRVQDQDQGESPTDGEFVWGDYLAEESDLKWYALDGDLNAPVLMSPEIAEHLQNLKPIVDQSLQTAYWAEAVDPATVRMLSDYRQGNVVVAGGVVETLVDTDEALRGLAESMAAQAIAFGCGDHGPESVSLEADLVVVSLSAQWVMEDLCQ